MSEDPAPLTLHRYAEALVYRSEYPAKDQPAILAKLELNSAIVAAAAAYWTPRIVRELESQRPTLMLELSRFYGQIEHQVRLERRPVAAIRPAAAPRVVDASRLAPRRQMVALERRVAVIEALPNENVRSDERVVPTYLRVAPAPPVPVQPPPPPNAPPGVVTEALPDDLIAVIDAMARARARPETAWLSSDEGAPASLPFLKDAAQTPPPVGAKRDPLRASEPSVGRGTAMAPEHFEPAPSLPFKDVEVSAKDIDLSMFPLERYAEVSVRLASGEERGKVLRRFVLTEAMWKVMSTAWGARVMDDAAMRAQYAEVVKELWSRLGKAE